MDRSIVLRSIALMVAVGTLILTGGAPLAQNQKQKPQTAPNNAPQIQQAAPNPPQTVPRHVLEGRWFVTWVGRSAASQMVISQVQSSRGVTTFSGQLAAPASDETCLLTGNVVDQAQISYSDGYEHRNVPLPSIVLIRGQCQNQIIQFELFGLPGGKILMNGRAALIEPGGNRSYEPVALSRP